MKTINYGKSSSKVTQFSIFPKAILYRLALGKVEKHSKFFISEKDYRNIRLIGNSSLLFFVISFVLFHYVTLINVPIALLISSIASLSFLFVLSDYIRTKILNRHQKFEETAFLIINSLSINMVATQSFPHSVELLLTKGIKDKYYTKYFQDMLYSLNLGENEDEIINNGGKIFLNKQYETSFQNIKNENAFIESDPEFILYVRKGIKLIEDNIVIFIAVSCLLPLVLSMVLSFLLPSNSPTIFVFPLLYAVFGTLILRFMNNKNIGD